MSKPRYLNAQEAADYMRARGRASCRDRELALYLLVAHDGGVTIMQDAASRRGRRAWDLFEELERLKEEGVVRFHPFDNGAAWWALAPALAGGGSG